MTDKNKRAESTIFANYCKNQDIKPISTNNYISIKKPNQPFIKKAMIDTSHINFSAYSLLDEPLYHDNFCNDGQKQIIKKLQQNKYQIIRTLDLHHFTQNDAILQLESFINGNITPGNTCLKIIHGKGLNSPLGRSVLKSLVRRFLEYHPRLLAYTNAPANNGGDGATLVKLKN